MAHPHLELLASSRDRIARSAERVRLSMARIRVVHADPNNPPPAPPGAHAVAVKDPNGTVNATPNYKALSRLLSKARLSGLVDWLAIEDRTRTSRATQHWAKPSDMVEVALRAYAIDKWDRQPHYLEVWVEKEALEQVLETACKPLDVRFFACRGYASQSSMWEASQRLLDKKKKGKEIHILHLGDHDPSGIDMSRNIKEQLSLFIGSEVHVQRVALNMTQVEKFDLPPDPAKTTDPRFKAYAANYGEESWELDALEPTVLVDRITRGVLQYRDGALWKESGRSKPSATTSATWSCSCGRWKR